MKNKTEKTAKITDESHVTAIKTSRERQIARAHEEIKQDKRNYRRHGDKNKAMIRRSLEECGAGRSILIDNENTAVAGNGVLEQAEKLGIPIRVIESDGSELIAVKRTDLSPDDPKRKELALADNATTDASEWDFDAMTDDGWNPEALSDWGVEYPEDSDEWGDVDEEAEREQNKYSNKIDGLIYEPNGNKPEIEQLFNSEKYQSLVDEIELSPLNEREKNFLKLAATRHIVFDYRKIADFYANSTKQVQYLMEKSALVIIDFNAAIENGFVSLAKEIDAMREEDFESSKKIDGQEAF